MKLIKIGDRWFTRTGFNLTEAPTPAEIPTEGSYLDATELAGSLDALDVDAMTARVNTDIAAYETARKAAQTGGTAELQAATDAQLPAVVGHFLRSQRKATLSDLSEPEAVEPNTPDEKPEEDTTPEAAPAEVNEPEETPEAPETPEPESEIEVPDSLQGLSAVELQQAVAAAAILNRKGGDSADLFAGLLPTKPATPATPATREGAVFVAAANQSVQAGAAMTDDQIAEEMQRWARGAKSGRKASSEVMGRFMMYGDSPSMVASAKDGSTVKAGSLGDFHARRAGARGIVAAAPERCGPNDVRRNIPDCGDNSSPLLNSLQSYPAPHCNLEYYRDISIADVADGITIWDTTARDAYQDALDAWRAEVAAGTPFDPVLYADLKAAEKSCTIAGCAPTDTVTMLPIAACLEYPNDLEYCSPESIRAYRRTLDRLFTRERTSNMLAVVSALSATVTVDAAAAPFVNTETTPVQLGAAAVVDYVIRTLKPQGVMAERVTAGNYSLVVPYGLQQMLELDNSLASGMEALGDAFGVSNVITTLDTATGTAIPYGAVPAAGSTTAFTALRAPQDWDIFLLDLDDFFEISRPDIELGAQVTPESIKGNMVFGGFMESFAGYGKDGCHPSWVISLSNLVYNGARPERMHPVGLLE